MSRRSGSSALSSGALGALGVSFCASGAFGTTGGTTWLDEAGWAWWALLAALVGLGILLLVLRAVGYKRLSPLWQCLVLSLLGHVVLTAIMSAIVISQPVLGLLIEDERDVGSVNLVVGEEAEIRTQVRYQLTELPVADPSLAALMRAALESIRSPEFQPAELDAPLTEPRAAVLATEPDRPKVAPPAVADRVSLQPKRPEPRTPEATRVHPPVADVEPRARAAPQRPPRLVMMALRPELPEAEWRAALLQAPAAMPAGESIVVPTPMLSRTVPQPPAAGLRAAPAADAPAVERPAVTEPIRGAEPAPPPVPMVATPPLRPQPPGDVGSPRRAASLTGRQVPPSADPRGSSLTSHLVADFRRPLVAETTGEPVHVRLALSPLGPIALSKLKIDKPLAHRAAPQRKKLLAKMGGSKGSESAVGRALAYLARNQQPDGRWSYIDEESGQPASRPAGHDEMGLTGLAALCFLAANHTPDEPGPYRQRVGAGLAFLMSRQKRDGDLRGSGDMYSHGIAVLALGEAAAMTRDPNCGEAAVRGAKFILKAQNRLTGGWRYVPGESGDTSVLGWQIMALHSVKRLGIPIPAATRAGALHWLKGVSRSRHGMLVGYQGPNPTPTMTAEGLFVRLLLAERLTEAQRKEAAAYITPPDPLEQPNFYYYYYGALALMQLQDDSWRKWNAEVRDRLTRTQHRGGKLDGSWDPSQSRWGGERGGRVYTTALATLTLEVYYRYLPMYGPAAVRRGRPD